MTGNRTWLIWLAASICAVVLLSAMSILTIRFVEQSNTTVKQGADAYLEERVRLAMWRLDTLAASIVGTEDARPAEDLFSKDFRESIQSNRSAGETVTGLYSNAPGYANVYWAVPLEDNKTKASSPQVYDESFLLQNKLDVNANREFTQKLERLNGILAAPVLCDEKSEGRLTNLDLVCESCHELPLDTLVEAAQKGNEQVSVQKRTDDFSLQSLNQQAPKRQKNSKVVNYKNAPEVQQKISQVEKGKRKKAVERIADNISNFNNWGPASAKNDASVGENGEALAVLEMSTFSPVWVDDELVLVRRVKALGVEKLQGVWLKKQEIRAQLLEEISDLFPTAELHPYLGKVNESTAENVMLRLPFMLIPQESYLSATNVGFKDVFDGPVGLAWLGAGFAMIAVFFMLRGVMKMSERRAAFVSSVTHELRTPLTTFRLYSDMLSSGLVKETVTQKKYLETLKTESERLTHLVENVLSFSQIERSGSTTKKSEELRVGALIERSTERLESRTNEANAVLKVQVSEAVANESVRVNTTAVEQILFNLVDNAAKYGCDCGSEIILSADIEKGSLLISVSDQGQGICRKERGRLFKPFHKTAEQAASTKPGVGLGLALCRKLARAMKGDLVYRQLEQGSCFILKVPAELK